MRGQFCFDDTYSKSRSQDRQIPVMSYKQAAPSARFPQTQTNTSQIEFRQPSSEQQWANAYVKGKNPAMNALTQNPGINL